MGLPPYPKKTKQQAGIIKDRLNIASKGRDYESMKKENRPMLWRYLFFTFAIAWGIEFFVIAVYRFQLLRGNSATVLHYMLIGFGAGMAPLYGAFIAQRKENGVTFKTFCKGIFYTANLSKTIALLLLFALIQLAACAIQEDYLGYPWYLFILFVLVMILGGGLEEVGWRGVLQLLLEERLPFFAAALIEGLLWSVWHLPLWLVPNASQGNMNFAAFALYCITFGLNLAVLYRLTKSVWAAVLLHAWGNTILGGMFSLTSLCNFPQAKTLLIYGIEIAVMALILFFFEKRDKPQQQ